ncbi:TAXI family TRAP transporter solute-binding subunit [Pseudalkalibacillus hwajinpoensis]|uniref:TAXI family TRAP transporter solute-binding subunit n=1 Tax=Guptibacillus hwajinpoensis TaxID=208199 RepID=A0A4U1MI92_9BACL|nr:TAXI family TRAP transporter solute-binding subunit [Pseudalkalibacillus hwajinpoensis]TKD70507.1 TAXI family TRAP transporter solute-binding subunit [Pseudalkalibacillus hwajinpoensis]
MGKKRLLRLFVAVLSLVMVIGACGGSDEEADGSPSELSLLTGGTGGTYFPLGGELATIIQDETDIENANAESTGASVENMQILQDGEGDIAFTQTDIAAYATKGELMFEDGKMDNIQAIGTLYPETIQIVTLMESGISSVADLKGKKVSVGAPSSGTYANAEQVLEIHGIAMEGIDAQHLAFDELTEGIQEGTIDAAFITSGTPTGALEGLSAIKPVKILPIEDNKISELVEKYPYYAEETIKSGTYGLESDVKTVAVLAMLVARSNLDEDYVYQMTKAIFDNSNKITHAKGEFITADTALEGVGIDLHPGAKKYFDEKGIE